MNTQLNGFFVQEEEADVDADPLTSEGIFVFLPATTINVNVGDKVKVTGTVDEYFGLTELKDIKVVIKLSSGESLPTAVNLEMPFASLTAPEKYEGMLVNLVGDISVTENFDLGRFGELMLCNGPRLMIPTQVAEPGSDAISILEQNKRNKIVLDDASNIQNPDLIGYLAPDGLSAENTIRCGYGVSYIKGVLSCGSGSYRIQPTSIPAFHADKNPRRQTPDDVGGTLKVASFNLLNYFNGDGMGGGFPTSRGADTPEEFTRQRDKIISVIVAINADVLGLLEIENDGYDEKSAIQDLVKGLNDRLGIETFACIDPGVSQIGTDEIAVCILYKTTSVEPVNEAKILDSSFDSDFIDTKNRPSLAQSFSDLGLCDGTTASTLVELKAYPNPF